MHDIYLVEAEPIRLGPVSRGDTYGPYNIGRPDFNEGQPTHTEAEKREIERKLVECLKHPLDIYLPGLEDPNEYRKRLNKKIRDLQNLKKCNELDQKRKELDQQLQELLELKEDFEHFEQKYGNENGRGL